ncbi:VanZ family protein [bacterium]|jgi:VanZ family protein|nr:VanZ family protein [bacterium]
MLVNAHPDLKLSFLWLSLGCVMVALVVYLSLTSSPVDTGLSFPYQDKVFHAFAYFVLMTWFAQIYHGRLQRNVIAVMLVIMGVMLEYLQSFDPNRYYEYADMLANSTGVVLGLLVTLTWVKNCLIRFEKLIR